MYDRVNKYTAKYLLIMNGQIKSKRLCRSTFCERDMLSNCVKHKPDAMLAGVCQWGHNILKHSSNPLGSLFVPFAFGLDWTGFSNIIDCLSKK